MKTLVLNESEFSLIIVGLEENIEYWQKFADGCLKKEIRQEALDVVQEYRDLMEKLKSKEVNLHEGYTICNRKESSFPRYQERD